MAKSCPVCSILVRGDDRDFQAHINICLDSQNSALLEKGDSEASCQICRKDLSRYNTTQRTQHVNRCCDNSEMLSTVVATSAQDEESDFVVSEVGRNSERICQYCSKTSRTKQAHIQHVKKCACQLGQKHNDASTSSNSIDSANDASTSGSSRLRNRRAAGVGDRRTRSGRKRTKDTADEDIELAMAMSKSLQQQEDECLKLLAPSKKKKKKSRGGRKGSEGDVPLLLQRSRAEGDRLVQARAEQLLFVDDEDAGISCTPALGISSMVVITPIKPGGAAESEMGGESCRPSPTDGPLELHSHVESSIECSSVYGTEGTDNTLTSAGGFSGGSEERCQALEDSRLAKTQVQRQPIWNHHHQLRTEGEAVYIEDVPVAAVHLRDVKYHLQLWRLSAASGPLTSADQFYVPKLLEDGDMALPVPRDVGQLAPSPPDIEDTAPGPTQQLLLSLVSSPSDSPSEVRCVTSQRSSPSAVQDHLASDHSPTDHAIVQHQDDAPVIVDPARNARHAAPESLQQLPVLLDGSTQVITTVASCSSTSPPKSASTLQCLQAVSDTTVLGSAQPQCISFDANMPEVATGALCSRLGSTSISSLRVPPKLSSAPRSLSVVRNTPTTTPIASSHSHVFATSDVNEADCNPERHAISDFALLVNKPFLSDVSIVAKGKERLFAHQVILAARSPTLARMFASDLEESHEKSIEDSWQLTRNSVLRFDDVPHGVLLSLLQYLYSGSVSFPPHHLAPLGSLAERLELPWLASHCQRAMLSSDPSSVRTTEQEGVDKDEGESHPVGNEEDLMAHHSQAELVTAIEDQDHSCTLSLAAGDFQSPDQHPIFSRPHSCEKGDVSPLLAYSQGSSPCLFDSDCNEEQPLGCTKGDASSPCSHDSNDIMVKDSQSSTFLRSLTPPTQLATPVLASQVTSFSRLSSVCNSLQTPLSIKQPSFPANSHLSPTPASPCAELVQLSDDEHRDEVCLFPVIGAGVESDDDCIVERVISATQQSPSHSGVRLSSEPGGKQPSPVCLSAATSPTSCEDLVGNDQIACENACASNNSFTGAFVHDDDGFNCDLELAYESPSTFVQTRSAAAAGEEASRIQLSPSSSDAGNDCGQAVDDLHNSTLLAAVQFSDDSISGGDSPKAMLTPSHTKGRHQSAITPMLNYDAMATPCIRAEAGKYGLKKFSKKRTVHMLKHIYNYRHSDQPQQGHVEVLETREGGEGHAMSEGAVQPTCRSPSESSEDSVSYQLTRTQRGCLEEVDGELFGEKNTDTDCLTISSESSDGEADMTKEFGCEFELLPADDGDCLSQVHQTSQNDQLRDFLFNHEEFYTQILQYQPLPFDRLKKSLTAVKIRVTERQLVSFLDEQCIVFSTGPRTRTARNTLR